MGYISHPKFLISWLLDFLPYHEILGEFMSKAPFILHPWNHDELYDSHHPLFVFLLISISTDIIILWMLLLCVSFFPLSHDASPPVVSMDILNSSISKFVTYVDFSKAPSSSTLTWFHDYCSFFNVFRMKWMMWTGDRLDSVWNTHGVLVFSKTTVIM